MRAARPFGVALLGAAVAAGSAAALLAVSGPIAPATRALFDRVTTLRVLELLVALAFGRIILSLVRSTQPHRSKAADVRPRIPLRRTFAHALDELPEAVALSLLVGCAAGIWIAVGRRTTLPQVFGDELIYSGLAKSIARGDGLALSGVSGRGYGLVYPALISPVYAFAKNGADAFAWVKAVNVVTMSLAAIPTYLFARCVVSKALALSIAALAVALPGMTYSSLVMTEPAFYPAFLLFALVLVRVLERPTVARQLLTVATLLALVTIRAQAIALVGACLTAVAVYGLSAGSARRALLRFAPTWSAFGLTAAVALAVTGGDPRAPLGAYGQLVRSYNPLRLIEWLAWNLTALEFAVGIAALLVFPIALAHLLRRSAEVSERAIGAVALSMTAWTLVSTAVLSASPFGLDRFHERNFFYVVPLLLVALAYWLTNGLERPATLTLVSTATVVALPLVLPVRLVREGQTIDAPAMIPWGNLTASLGSFPVTRVMAVAAAAAVWSVLVRSTIVPVLAVLLAFFTVIAENQYHPQLTRTEAARLAWVDDALPRSSRATLVYVDLAPSSCAALAKHTAQPLLARGTEFFNTRVDRVVHVFGDNPERALGSERVTLAPDGSLLERGSPLAPRYVVTDSRVAVVGTPVARLDPRSLGPGWDRRLSGTLTLWKVGSSFRIAHPAALAAARRRALACTA